MPTTYVRYLAGLVLLLGLGLLVWRTGDSSSGGYNGLRLIHILVALGLIGLYEVTFARTKRAGQLPANGRQLGLAGRVTLTLALVVGLILLVSLAANLFSGTTYDLVVYLHTALGLAGVVLTVLVFSGRAAAS